MGSTGIFLMSPTFHKQGEPFMHFSKHLRYTVGLANHHRSQLKLKFTNGREVSTHTVT